ncbi:11877_t:CDS:2 [Ambispora gerdemannii]|uniref:11877_t:CDS:1 n=1 Tax=Ambispora gerdemannii TaxID=144530 RepID=A0A9N9CTJ1_9GLOM|nr:11877_t:CDS:2 [Ambispora gerdemannii]
MTSIPALIAFYHVTAIEDWTHVNISEYYREKLKNKEYKFVMDSIKKDLVKVKPVPNLMKYVKKKLERFLTIGIVRRLVQAETLGLRNKLSNGDELLVRRLVQAGLLVCSVRRLVQANWVSSKNLKKDSDIRMNIEHLQIEQLATGDSQITNNHCIRNYQDANNGGDSSSIKRNLRKRKYEINYSELPEEDSDSDREETIKDQPQKRGRNEGESMTNDRSRTPTRQIVYPANPNLFNQLNKEKQRAKTTCEPICSNIIDTTNNLLMERLKIKRDYPWASVINEATKYIDELIDNSDTRDKFCRKLQLSFFPSGETYSFRKHY